MTGTGGVSGRQMLQVGRYGTFRVVRCCDRLYARSLPSPAGGTILRQKTRPPGGPGLHLPCAFHGVCGRRRRRNTKQLPSSSTGEASPAGLRPSSHGGWLVSVVVWHIWPDGCRAPWKSTHGHCRTFSKIEIVGKHVCYSCHHLIHRWNPATKGTEHREWNVCFFILC